MRDRVDVLRHCLDRGGVRRGARVAEFIAEWEIAVRSNGGPVGIEEFARWWKESRMTAYRRQDEFRAMFPELGPHATPEALMGPLLDRLAAGQAVDDVSLDWALVT